MSQTPEAHKTGNFAATPAPTRVLTPAPPPTAPLAEPNVVYQMQGFQPNQTVQVVSMPLVGPESMHMICPNCHTEINTTTKPKISMIAWLIGTILCVCGCCLGCCLIPCCIKRCKDIIHTCPKCGTFLGEYRSCTTRA